MSTLKSKFTSAFNKAFSTGRYLAPNPRVQKLSISSVMLEMYFRDQMLAKGTGWFWRLPDGIALVTAWHNFSGLHHTHRLPLNKSGGMPDRIRFRYVATDPQTFQEAEIPLYLDEDLTEPRWLVHPICGSFFDMAYIAIDMHGGQVACVNDSIPVMNSSIDPGFDVFAVGFPQGVKTMNIFPVWKRGTVASDGDHLVDGHPKFYIDLAGRGGLSGAPVYRVQQGVVLEQNDGDQQSVSFGSKKEFLGLYSGRAADQLPPEARSGESTDLGFVWRADVVLEMLAGGVLDEQPEVGKGTHITSEIWGKPAEA